MSTTPKPIKKRKVFLSGQTWICVVHGVYVCSRSQAELEERVKDILKDKGEEK